MVNPVKRAQKRRMTVILLGENDGHLNIKNEKPSAFASVS
jgi:hypothetical protein